MADQSAEARLLGPSSSPEEVLTFLTRLLGKGVFKNDDEKASHAAAAQERATRLWSAIPWENSVGSTSEGSKREEDEVADPDFSSFPSLSLERSPREQLEGDLNRRASIEAHVSSLLSRPILVSNSATKSTLSEENENESDALEFIAEKSEEVPNLMLQNFFTSFSTLLNSRLRAYATFLARHGLSLFECSETAEELEDGVTGVEQKLETMLEIGRLVSADAVVTSFQAKPEEAKVINDEEQVDEQKVSVPLVMEASINISIPRPVGDGSESITVSFRANGNITGKT